MKLLRLVTPVMLPCVRMALQISAQHFHIDACMEVGREKEHGDACSKDKSSHGIKTCDAYKRFSDRQLAYRIFALRHHQNHVVHEGTNFCIMRKLSTIAPLRFLRYRDIHCGRGEKAKAVLTTAFTWLTGSKTLGRLVRVVLVYAVHTLVQYS